MQNSADLNQSDFQPKTPQEPQTNVKETSDQKENQQDEYQKKLRQIQDHIQNLGKRLREIYTESLGLSNQEFQKRKDLQQERTIHRKKLLDLADAHKSILNQRQAQLKRQVQQRKQAERQEKQKQETQKQEVQNTGEKKQEQTTQQVLAASRRRARIAQIETELALSSLRRSRRLELDLQLDAIRRSYLLSYPSPYYPYYRYGLPRLYPYSFGYPYPYPASYWWY